MTTVADLIRAHASEIIGLWSAEAAQSASARGLDQPSLCNFMPRYLGALAEAGPGLGEMRSRPRALVEGHLGARLRQGFEVAEIVAEFASLGPCIARLGERLSADETVDAVEMEALLKELHLAAVYATRLFAEHMGHDEQTEKRASRRMEALVRERAAGAAPPSEWLPELLEIVREAMQAQSAALLLVDAASNQLETAATAGIARPDIDDIDKGGHSLDPRTFTGAVAANEEALVIVDVESTALEVQVAQRRGGIRALLGVRLATRERLVGVLYVGLTESRSFTPGEVRRIESMGARLTLHLEGAALEGELVAKVAALQAERALRDRLVATVAHDLRGPLSAAKLNVTALALRPEKLDVRRDLAVRIERSIDRATRMIDDLLDANRIQAGHRLALHLEPSDLVSLARQVIDELDREAQARLALEAPPALVGIWAREPLRRALWNLVTNALKFGEPGRPVTVRLRDEEGRARITVHNFGAPLSDSEQRSIFEPFSRTTSAERDGLPGWGLGLTLVLGCAEAHGGVVTVTSGPGRGTAFTIDLPFDARPHQPEGANVMGAAGPV